MNLYIHYLFYTFLLVTLASSELPPSIFTVNGHTYIDEKKEVILDNGQCLRYHQNKLIGEKGVRPLTTHEILELKNNILKFEIQEKASLAPFLQQLMGNLMRNKDKIFANINTTLDAVRGQIKPVDRLVHSQLDKKKIENRTGFKSNDY